MRGLRLVDISLTYGVYIFEQQIVLWRGCATSTLIDHLIDHLMDNFFPWGELTHVKGWNKHKWIDVYGSN